MTLDFPRLDLPGFDPARIRVTDASFREGLQAMAPLTPGQAVRIFRLISRISGPEGLVSETDFFIHQEAQRVRLEACRELGLAFPEISVWIRASLEDLSLLEGLEPTRVSVVMPCSDIQLHDKLGLSRMEATHRYMGMVAHLLARGHRVKCSLEDVTRAEIHGFVGPLMACLRGLGDDRVSFRLCDTLGLGVPMEGAGIQRSVPTLIGALLTGHGIPGGALEWHAHNDFHMAVASSVAAWVAGAAKANGSFLGLGERSGIAPLEALVMQAHQLKGQVDPGALEAFMELRDYMALELGVTPGRCYPVLGEEYLKVRSGIHADGLEKSGTTYYPFDAAQAFNRPVLPVITDISGLSGLAAWVRATGRRGPGYKGKKDERLRAMKAEIDLAYAEGRTREFTEPELEALYARHFGKPTLHAAS